jgi:co-chaperonin GroES (HSP10)
MQANDRYVLMHRVKEKMETKSGLMMSDKDMKELRYERARVVSAGPLVEGLKADDEVYFDKVHGHDVMFDGVLYTMCMSHHIVAVV